MSREGTPTDNPIIEALNGWIKEELFLDFNLSTAEDVPSLLNNYVFHVLDNLPFIEERIKMIDTVTKEEIVAIANKIKMNISFVLEGEENNGDN